jgi:1-aminocyclopropane-1-carboxylate deaminase
MGKSYHGDTKLLKNVDLNIDTLPTPLTEIFGELFERAGVKVFVKRDDLIHSAISGNKWRKLKYNLIDAKSKGFHGLATFGGAYSNHLAATAAAGQLFGFGTMGFVRGEEHALTDTPTLRYCREQGMQLQYVTRQEYRQRHVENYIASLQKNFPDYYFIPEGGTSVLALLGVGEMVDEVRHQLGGLPTYFAVAGGTGGTAAGILATGQDVLAFSALKGGAFLEQDIAQLTHSSEILGALQLFTEYHFGGYAKWNHALLDFIIDFKQQHGIQLEQVYTAKMFYGLFDLIGKGFFQHGATIVAVHTGGLQGLLPALQ